ncbi:polysaccharide biosynthesis tyrosine autokinase [Paludibacter sp.]
MNENLNKEDIKKHISEKAVDWRELLDKYLIHWKLILISIVVALLLGFLCFRIEPNEYQFKTSLLITDNSSNGHLSQMSVLKQLDAFGMSSGAYTNIYNEVRVIKSQELIKKVIKKLKLYNSYSTIQFFKPIDLYHSSPIEVSMQYDDMLQLISPIKLSVALGDNSLYQIQVKYEHNGSNIKNTTNVSSLPTEIETHYGKIKIELKHPNIKEDEKIYVKIINPIYIVKSYQENALTAEVPKDGDLIDITFTENNIQKGKDFLRTLVEIYNQDAIDQINKSANFTALFIDSRLSLLTDELTYVEGNLQEYKQKNNITNIETDAGLYLQRSTSYEQKRNELEIQLQLVEYIEEFLKDQANKYALIPNLGLTDVGLVSVIQEYNKLMVSHDRIASGSSSNNPTLQTMELQIQSSRKSIQNSIATSRRGLQISISELESQNTFLSSQLKKVPQQEREFLEIKRQQEIKASLYMFLLQKREEATLSMAVTVPKARVLDAADSADRTSPKLFLILAGAFVLGLLLPLTYLYLKFMLTRTFSDVKEVEKLTSIPVISELVLQKGADAIIDHRVNANSNSELLRLMRSKIQLIFGKSDERLILVTSTEPGEGKTFVCINLAISLSLTGKKVIIIGMDLRKPMLATHFGITQQEGISSYLSGIENDYNKLICSAMEFPNLKILPAGIIPPNPNELIISERFDNLIEELQMQYDYIVVDSAPVGVVSDSFLVNRVANLTLYVCRANYSDKRNLEYLNSIKNEKLLNQIYLVVNGIDLSDKRYVYGYGYGYDHNKLKTKK